MIHCSFSSIPFLKKIYNNILKWYWLFNIDYSICFDYNALITIYSMCRKKKLDEEMSSLSIHLIDIDQFYSIKQKKTIEWINYYIKKKIYFFQKSSIRYLFTLDIFYLMEKKIQNINSTFYWYIIKKTYLMKLSYR